MDLSFGRDELSKMKIHDRLQDDVLGILFRRRQGLYREKPSNSSSLHKTNDIRFKMEELEEFLLFEGMNGIDN